VPVTLQPYVTGYGENTLVWYPTSLNPASQTATFPFSGADTVYTVTVSNVVTTAGAKNYTYSVTLFDPATTGADYSPVVISGTNQPLTNLGNPYTCTIVTNPSLSGYQWLTAQATNGSLTDNALNGLTNFTISPTPIYPIVTNPPTGTGLCFHLCHTNPVPQLFQLKEILFVTNGSSVSFKSLLGYATTAETARVQVSADSGTTWQDIYTQVGTGGSGDASFTQHTLSLTSYTNKSVLLRFNYDFSTGSYFPQIDSYVGWCLENIVLTNIQQLLSVTTNSTVSTNFIFTPTQTGNYVMQARGVIFSEFPLDLGPAKQVTALAGPPVITLSNLIVTNNQVKINFTLAGTAASFHLLQANQLPATWTTNGTAVLTTNVVGVSFQFTTTNGPSTRFYKVQTP